MKKFNPSEHPHRRYNPLLNEWILVSPQRGKRPWQGQNENIASDSRPEHDENCYLCSGNERSNGVKNNNYTDCYVFENDFSALLREEVYFETKPINYFNKNPKEALTK